MAVFDFLSWGHLLVLALGAFFIFGPERLPTLARDAARGVKRFREVLSGMREQMGGEMGVDFAQLRDLDLRRYHPRTFLREQLFGDETAEPATPMAQSASGATAKAPRTAPGPAGTVLPPGQVGRSVHSLPPPFDVDAT